MTHYKVINRTTRQTQIFNAKEYANFFGYLGGGKYRNNRNNYAVSTTLSPKDTERNNLIDTIGFVVFSLGLSIGFSTLIFQIIK